MNSDPSARDAALMSIAPAAVPLARFDPVDQRTDRRLAHGAVRRICGRLALARNTDIQLSPFGPPPPSGRLKPATPHRPEFDGRRRRDRAWRAGQELAIVRTCRRSKAILRPPCRAVAGGAIGSWKSTLHNPCSRLNSWATASATSVVQGKGNVARQEESRGRTSNWSSRQSCSFASSSRSLLTASSSFSPRRSL